MPDDGFAQHDQTAMLAFFKSIGMDDPYEVIRLPAEGSAPTSIRLRPELRRAIEQNTGRGTRFLNKSDFIQHCVAVGLKAELAMNPDNAELQAMLSPVIVQIDRLAKIENKRALDDLIRTLPDDLNNADGVLDLSTVIDRANRMMIACERLGYTHRAEQLRSILAVHGVN